MKDIRELTGRNVLVKAGGLTYTGILLEVGLEAVVLRSSTGHSEIPVEKVTSIEELGEGPRSSLPPSPLRKASR
jgi:hypothetical protein